MRSSDFTYESPFRTAVSSPLTTYELHFERSPEVQDCKIYIRYASPIVFLNFRQCHQLQTLEQ